MVRLAYVEPRASRGAVQVEVCVEGPDGALVAQQAGAQRVELCSALAVGGVTPSPGLFETVRAATELPVMVLVRPRRGDFLYTAAEFETLCADVQYFSQAGAAGVVTGVLRSSGEVDRERMQQLVELARPAEVTFHRAFDHTRDLSEALEVLLSLEVDRVLTSGGAASAAAGVQTLKSLVQRAGDRLSIMPGGGIRAANAAELVEQTQAREVHLSAGRWHASSMAYRNPECLLGASAVPGELELCSTDGQELRQLLASLPQVSE